MLLEQLSISHCRIIEAAELALSPGVNLICGNNGSGKSCILEAVTILSRGRSFRSAQIADVIRHGEESMLIRAKSSDGDNHFNIGIEKTRHSTRIRVNQQDLHTQAALSRFLPVSVIDPSSVELLTGSPALRRAYIDWIAFYLFPEFHKVWQSYRRILKQRNLCLRVPAYLSALPVWTDELIKAQIRIQDYRDRSLLVLEPQLNFLASALLENHCLSVELTTGFPKGVELSEEAQRTFYAERRDSEIKSARTLSGAHRADLRVMFNQQPAQHTASRGQLKLIVIAMLLAQSRSIDIGHERKGIIAIDDLPAELDSDNKTRLLSTLRELDQQLLLTTTHPEIIPLHGSDRMFHVKHGVVTQQCNP